jgi:UPF0755 protein
MLLVMLRRAAQLSLLLAIIIAGLAVWGYMDLRTPVAHTRAATYLEIPRGSSAPEIVARLADAGVIRRRTVWPLLAYIKLTAASPHLKAGQYRFASPITPLDVLRKLRQGEQRLIRLTVIEGWTRWDIAAAMARTPELNLPDAQAALALMDNVSLIADLDPHAQNLEGYMYPDTYYFPPNTTAPQLVQQMVRRFRQEWDQKFAATARSRNLTPHEVITIAALIETEAKLREERPLISSVIQNRLHKELPLGIDSTVIYASKLAGKWKNDGKVYQSDLDLPSPYNTRKFSGLPPGPIASPGASSIEAALNPAATDYLYYVRDPARDDGAHNFYQQESDFQRGVQALRDWERARDARARGTN